MWADSLKGLLMVFVVLGHAIQFSIGEECENNHLWNYIYSFHMPTFMAVSGYLAFRRGVNNRFSIIYKRTNQLLVPFLLWSLIKWATFQRCDMNMLCNIILYPDEYFWFLWVLFFIVVFFNLGAWIAEKLKVKQEVVIVGLALCFVVLMVAADIRILGFQFFSYYFMFYVVGYYMHKYDRLIISSTWVLAILAIMWVVMASFWKMHELPIFLTGIPLPQTLMQYGYRFVTALVAVYTLLSVCPKLLDGTDKWNKTLAKYGQISLGIYVVHLLLIPYIVTDVRSFSNDIVTVSALSFIIALIISWLAVCLLGNYKITARWLLGKV